MLRNLMVTGVVSVVMAITTLALQSLAPPGAQPTMDGETFVSQEGAAGEAPSQAPMGSQQTFPQNSSTEAVAGQISGVSSNMGQTTGGMTGSGQLGGGMMMCPCMQMMMGDGMGAGTMGGQTNGSAAATQPLSNPRTKEQATERAELHLQSLGNPNLKVGKVNETAAFYEIEVVTQDGSLVNRLILDKQSGEIKTQY